MQLDGLLSRVALRDLLELSVASLVSGAIEVHAPAGVHRIFFVQGACVHATSPSASGFDALWPLFELSDAAFRFVAGATTVERTITDPADEIIGRAEALARQWSALRPHIPHLDLVPQFATPANSEQVQIFEEDWPILSWVDGTRTITQIVHAAMLDPLEVCGGLLRLKERGLVAWAERRVVLGAPDAPPAVVQQPKLAAMQPKQQTSFFAKLLHNAPTDLLESPVATDTQAHVEAAHQAATADQPGTTEYDDILRLLRT